MSTLITYSAEETVLAGRQFARTLGPGTVVALQGDLGAGKSTFLQGVLAALGIPPPYPSPTFVIMHQYDLAVSLQGARRVYHVDAYRVDAAALRNIGWDEWLADSEGIVFVEWPERVSELVPQAARRIAFAHMSEGSREITME